MTTTKYARFRAADGSEHDLVAAPGQTYTTEIDGRTYVLRMRWTEKPSEGGGPDPMELIPEGPTYQGFIVAGPCEEPIA